MPSHDSPRDDLIGVVIADRYRIISHLGEGGMGVTYRAWDQQAGVPVVVKIPKRSLLQTPGVLERFSREVKALLGLRHPHIVPVVDAGEHDGLPFVVMPFLPGGSLSNRRLRDEQGQVRQNPPGMLHLWLPAVADALDHVHSNGLVHRDVKPGNIFFDAFWGAFLGDFGIAKIVGESDAFDKEHTLTATNMGIGTPEYMGPEQFVPKPILDGRTDQYALAVIVYEMLTGTRPFKGEKAHIVVEITSLPPLRLDALRPGLPSSLVAAVHRGLAKSQQERFSTCRDFVQAALQNVPPLQDEAGVSRFLCPACGNILKLPVEAVGKKGRCPRCKSEMRVAEGLSALWLTSEELAGTSLSSAQDDSDPTSQPISWDELSSGPITKQTQETNPFKRLWNAATPAVRWTAIGAAAVIALVLEAVLVHDWSTSSLREQLAQAQAAAESAALRVDQLSVDNVSLRKQVATITAEAATLKDTAAKPAKEPSGPSPLDGLDKLMATDIPAASTQSNISKQADAANYQYDHDILNKPIGTRWNTASTPRQISTRTRASAGPLNVVAANIGGTVSHAFTADESLLATTDGYSVALWDTRSGEFKREIPLQAKAVRFLPHSHTLLVRQHRGVKLIDTDTEALPLDYWGHSGEYLWAVDVDTTGKRLATAGNDSFALIWDVASRAIVHRLKGKSNWIADVTFSPDGSRIITCEDKPDRRVVVWDATTGLQIAEASPTCRLNFSAPSAARISKDNQRIFIAMGDGDFVVLDGTSLKEIHRVPGTSNGTSKQELFVNESGDTVFHLGTAYDTQTFQRVQRPREVSTGMVYQQGKCFRRGNEPQAVSIPQIAAIRQAAGSRTGSHLALVVGSDSDPATNTVLWDLRIGRPVRTFEGRGTTVSFAPDTESVLMVNPGGPAMTWASEGDRVTALPPATRGVMVRNNRALLENGSEWSLVRTDDGSVLRQLPFPKDFGVSCWQADANAAVIVCGSYKKSFLAIDFNTGQEIARVQGQQDGGAWTPQYGICFVADNNDPDGTATRVALGIGLPYLSIWNYRTGSLDKAALRPEWVADRKYHFLLSCVATSDYLCSFTNSSGNSGRNERMFATWRRNDLTPASSAADFLGPITSVTRLGQSNTVCMAAREAKIISLDGTRDIARIIHFNRGADWVVLSPEGGCLASEGGARFLGICDASKPLNDPTPTPSRENLGTLRPDGQGNALATHAGANSLGMDFVPIPPGKFMMGEGPSAVAATLSRDFLLGKTEVTRGQWEQVMGTTPWGGEAGASGAELPAVNVSWEDAREFCEKLTVRERSSGKLQASEVYRLPTEAEWEYACRAGTTTVYSFGDEESKLGDFGWFGGNSGGNAHPVAAKKPNAWGLYDMHGNVWEWCSDWNADILAGGVDPEGPTTGSNRVHRGGSWLLTPVHSRSAFRSDVAPSFGHVGLGFRVARSQSGGIDVKTSVTSSSGLRRKWVQDDGARFFQREADSPVWREHGRDGKAGNAFNHLGETADYVEIVDEGRKMVIRLWSDRWEWTTGARTGPWNAAQKGRWEK
jgi:formylglycine-generating enzyme required for sulfatase activity/serine/threonine protein kinase/WD40 repeat protein